MTFRPWQDERVIEYERADCPRCKAASDAPCVSVRTGKPLKVLHAERTQEDNRRYEAAKAIQDAALRAEADTLIEVVKPLPTMHEHLRRDHEVSDPWTWAGIKGGYHALHAYRHEFPWNSRLNHTHPCEICGRSDGGHDEEECYK